MTEFQVWTAMYLAVGSIMVYGSEATVGEKGFVILLWPICVFKLILNESFK